MTSTTKTRTQIIAESIATSAMEQGLSVDGVRRYDLTTADCDYIRDEYPTAEHPADAIGPSEWRLIMADVERAVREYV